MKVLAEISMWSFLFAAFFFFAFFFFGGGTAAFLILVFYAIFVLAPSYCVMLMFLILINKLTNMGLAWSYVLASLACVVSDAILLRFYSPAPAKDWLGPVGYDWKAAAGFLLPLVLSSLCMCYAILRRSKLIYR